MINFDKLKTAGEYENGLKALLMGDDQYPEFGYKPIDIKRRIEELLLKEKDLKKLKSRFVFTCPDCGYKVHGQELR